MTNAKEALWQKEKLKFAASSLIGFFFLIISFFAPPIFNRSDLTKKIGHLESYKIRNGSKINRVEISIKEDNETYKIHRHDKMYLERSRLMNIEKGELITLYTHGDKLLQLEYENHNLIDVKKATQTKERNRTVTRIVGLVLISILLLPVLFKSRPNITIGKKNLALSFNAKFGFTLFILIVVLVFFLKPNLQF